MKCSKYLRYMAVFAVGIALMLNYMGFILNYKELSGMDENFIYIYTDSELPEEIVEECHKYQMDCEIWSISDDRLKNGKENRISIAMVKGVEALGYREAENLFLGSDFMIDVNLLKWVVYSIIFFCFFCVMVICFCQNKKFGDKKCFYFVVMPVWFLYVRGFLFAGKGSFPVWALPEKWSDMEGWGILREEVLEQLSYVIYFRDCPIVCKCYEGIIKSIIYLLLSLLSAYLFFKLSANKFTSPA